jgi:hypothetical protein
MTRTRVARSTQDLGNRPAPFPGQHPERSRLLLVRSPKGSCCVLAVQMVLHRSSAEVVPMALQRGRYLKQRLDRHPSLLPPLSRASYLSRLLLLLLHTPVPNHRRPSGHLHLLRRQLPPLRLLRSPLPRRCMLSLAIVRTSSQSTLVSSFRSYRRKEMVCSVPTVPHGAVTLTRYLGWWLCMNVANSAQGWAPEAYLEEQVAAAAPRPAPPPPPPAPKATTNGTASAAAAKAKPTPPAPPAKRPAAGGRKPLAPPARDSAVSLASHDSSGGSGRATPNSVSNASLAGGLAEALRQRQSALRGAKEDEDDW